MPMPRRKIILPSRANIKPSDDVDPLPHYYRPVIGWFFRRRLEIGLEMLDREHYPRVLEVGYGSGVLLKTLATFSTELCGVDFHSNIAPVEEMMKREGFQARLGQGDILKLNFPKDTFDAVFCYSTLEHVPDTDQAVSELARVLKPDGTAIIGFPTVNLTMDLLFHILGCNDIEHHHVSGHNKILASCRRIMQVERVRHLPPGLPMFATLYVVCKCRKRPATFGGSTA
jgi:2-polyprenyl-3-methyl-5-hydroxy-6-metoxy-1,4-benzoquinol methylase